MQETRIWSLGREDPLEKETATHSNILAQETPWTGAWWVTGHGVARKARHDSATQQHQQQMNQFGLTGICRRLYPTTEESIFKNLFIFNWRIILQCSVGFCHKWTWISHRYTYVPSLLSLHPTSHPRMYISFKCLWNIYSHRTYAEP